MEVEVRKYLFSKGYRFRKNDRRYQETQKIILPKYHELVFVHGCFWFRHEVGKDSTTPKTRKRFWIEQFDQDINNDQIKQGKLKGFVWIVIVIWECELKKDFKGKKEQLEKELVNQNNNA